MNQDCSTLQQLYQPLQGLTPSGLTALLTAQLPKAFITQQLHHRLRKKSLYHRRLWGILKTEGIAQWKEFSHECFGAM